MTLKISDYLEKQTSQVFVCDVWSNDEFNLISLDGMPYIIATGKMHWPINAEHYIIDNNDILISLLSLHEKLTSVNILDRKSVAGLEKEFPITDVEKICLWCEKHGSPFPPNKTGDMLGIRLGDFLVKLDRLYDSYKIWQSIAFGESKTKEEKEQIQENLNRLNRCPLYAHVDYSVASPRLFFRCQNMFDLAHTQLSFMATSPLGWSIAFCENCQTRFKKEHGNQKFCAACSKTRYQISRNKKRGERQKNAQES